MLQIVCVVLFVFFSFAFACPISPAPFFGCFPSLLFPLFFLSLRWICVVCEGLFYLNCIARQIDNMSVEYGAIIEEFFNKLSPENNTSDFYSKFVGKGFTMKMNVGPTAWNLPEVEGVDGLAKAWDGFFPKGSDARIAVQAGLLFIIRLCVSLIDGILLLKFTLRGLIQLRWSATTGSRSKMAICSASASYGLTIGSAAASRALICSPTLAPILPPQVQVRFSPTPWPSEESF